RPDRAPRRPEPQPRLVLPGDCAGAGGWRRPAAAARGGGGPAPCRRPAARFGRLHGRALAGDVRAAGAVCVMAARSGSMEAVPTIPIMILRCRAIDARAP